MPKKTKPTINFSEQFVELEKITANFEAGKYDLETGLKKFEDGLQLAKNLQQYLQQVEQRIATIKTKYHEPTSKTKA
ncbi:MAG: exodeoxyribonuclease VII small subunit [Patescibacteria group bacterium]|jgi:exodeoxyribonuclease VII small subunit